MCDETSVQATVEKAQEHHNAGFNCAEAVLLATCETTGCHCECIPRIATGLGGGVGSQGELCGALTGGVLTLGLLYGRDRADEIEKKEAVRGRTAQFVRQFAEKNGAIRCRDILGVELNTEAGNREYQAQNLKQECCAVAIRNAVRILLELKNE